MKMIKRISAILLALLLATGCFTGAALAAPEPPAEAGKLGQIRSLDPEKLFPYAAEDEVTAIVVFDGVPTAQSQSSERFVARRIARQHDSLRGALRQARIDYREQFDYNALLNGMAITVAYGQLEKIAALPGVASVHVANEYTLPEDRVQMESANEMTGSVSFRQQGWQGSGTVIAVLDTGITLEHEAFGVYEGMLEQAALSEEQVQSFIETQGYGSWVSEKIPFAYDYADLDDDATDDSSGHGTHVSAIAAGYARTEEGELHFCGSAPDAQILAMKVFPTGQPSTNSAIYFKALEDAYLLGADVINMSLGSYSGFSYDADLEDEVFAGILETLEQQGVALLVAAGNEGSMADAANNKAGHGYVTADYADYGTLGAPASYPYSISVASAENSRYPYHTLLAGDREIRYEDATGSGIYTALADLEQAEYAVVPGVGSWEDFEGLMVEGRVALVARGELSFQEKADNAARAGAIAMLVYNNEDGVIHMALDNRNLPAASISKEDGEYLISLAETVQPPEKEPVTELTFEEIMGIAVDHLTLLVFDNDKALSPQSQGDGLATQPVTLDWHWGEDDDGPFQYSTITLDPAELAFYEREDDEGHNMFCTQDGRWLTMTETGGLYLAEEPSPYAWWYLDPMFRTDEESGIEEYLGLYYMNEGSAEDPEPLYLCYADGAVRCEPLDESRQAQFLVRNYFDPSSSDEEVPLVPTDLGSLALSPEQHMEESENAGRMSDFSSWGTTPELGFKPQISAVGGNVYSASFQTEKGYELMSGTSMATPDLSGVFASLLQYLKEQMPELDKPARAELAQALLESGARLLTDAEGGLYSPRKQGAGLADLENSTAVKAYIPQPLAALGESKDGNYQFSFTVRSLGQAVSYRVDTAPMTDKAEQIDGSWYNSLRSETLTPADYSFATNLPENVVSVPAGGEAEVRVELRLSEAAKARFAEIFPNGSFLDGFVTLTEVSKQPDPPAGSFRFDDVKQPSRFFYTPVYWAYEHDPRIANGVTKTSFEPNKSATRGEVMTFLWRAAGAPAPKKGTNPFADVEDGRFYAKAVLWAYQQGIAKGVSDDQFAPNEVCTRAQFVTFLHRFAKKPAAEQGKNPFGDVKRGSFYYNAVLWAAEQGITTGTSKDAFSPEKLCTRGEIMTFLYRYLAQPADWEETAEGAPIHASYMGFFGDWAQAPIMEPLDWRDDLEALYRYNETGELELSQGEVNTSLSTVYTLNRLLLESFGMFYGGFAGDNIQIDAAFNPAHSAISPGGTYDLMVAQPMLLRNARRVIMTVTNLDSGKLVWTEDRSYVTKAYFNPEIGAWQGQSFLFEGKDMEDQPLPNNSRLQVDFYAEPALGEDPLGSLAPEELAAKAQAYRVWSFPLGIDTEIPVLEQLRYDAEAQALKLRVRDNGYLAAVRLGRQLEPEEPGMEPHIEIQETIGFSDESPNQVHEVTLEHVEDGVYFLNLYDYAGNVKQLEIWAGPGEMRRIGLNEQAGGIIDNSVTEILAAEGNSFLLPGINTYYIPDFQFVGWMTEPIDGLLEEADMQQAIAEGRLIPQGEPYTVTGDQELYAVYSKALYDPYKQLQFFNGDSDSWEGVLAITGFNREDYCDAAFLNADGKADRLEVSYDEDLGEYRLYGAEDRNLFQLEEYVVPETHQVFYTIRSCETGLYLTGAQGSLDFAEDFSEDCLWNVFYSDEEQMIGVVAFDESGLLAYDAETGEFLLLDPEAYEYERNSLAFYVPSPYGYAYCTAP